MSEKVANTFQEGMNLDSSDMVLKNTVSRYNLNVRIINLSGSSFVVSNLNGNEIKFQLSSGFIPVATQEHRNILYIVSWNETTQHLELGSFPSPDPASGSNYFVYRPFNNFIGGPTVGDVTNAFRVPMATFLLPNTFPIIQKLEIQPDYDRSSNVLFTVRGYKPRIVNTKFSAESVDANLVLDYVPDRSGLSNSNTYTASTIEKETSTVIYSPKILKVAYNNITTGGRLKPGNYVYVFHYMTEDFNKTNVVGQSSVCQIAFGTDNTIRKGGNETQETDFRVILNLTNVDVDFKYFKVYCLYSSGQDTVSQQYLEFTNPIQITGSEFEFTHTGYEELSEVSQDTVNVDYSIVDGADVSTQIGGYYVLGGIRQRSFNLADFKTGTIEAILTFKEKQLSVNALPGYSDPENVYNNMGHFGREAYPFGIVYTMPDGSLSPVFPFKGVDFDSTAYGAPGAVYEPTPSGEDWYKGVVRFPWTNHYPIYDEVSNTLRVKGLTVDVANIPDNVRQNSTGFFIVRANRNSELITQGVLVPTMKAPTRETVTSGIDYDTDVINQDDYYSRFGGGTGIDDEFFFKRIPSVDNMAEMYTIDNVDDGFSFTVRTDTGTLNKYAPLYIWNPKDRNGAKPEIFFKGSETWLRHWAFISGDALMNEPYYVSNLQKDNCGIHQLDKIDFKVGGKISPAINGWVGEPGNPVTVPGFESGLFYEFLRFKRAYTSKTLKKALKIVFVPGETFAPSGSFISMLSSSFFLGGYDPSGFDSTASSHGLVHQAFNAYFGIEMETGSDGHLADAGRGPTLPVAGFTDPTKRSFAIIDGDRAASNPGYANYGQTINAGFLVNVYRSSTTDLQGWDAINNLYPTVDSLTYRQVSQRYSWDEAAALSNKIDVFGGDCYISKVFRKIYQSGDREPAVIHPSPNFRWNVDMGQMISWWQESAYNAHLREPKRFDESETQDRSFFPYQSAGSFDTYRNYRYPETTSHSLGYSELTTPKGFNPVPNLAPYIENYFFSRVMHSEKHIPNAFKNGYRIFLETNFRDYDSSMGRMTGLFNHRGRLLIVFESGIGITEIEQRIQTGGDAAGSIFVEPSGVLPPTMQYVSREIGCQDHLSFVQTPSAVYALDRNKSKIWQFRDKLEVISDESISSFILKTGNPNPRSGYDLQNNEVLFTTDNYTLCFKEGLEKFTSFYSFQPNMYARRNNDIYSFIGAVAWEHNQPNYTIYGEEKNSIVEFVVNTGMSTAKVVDYLNIISNEIPPVKVEFYSYNQEVDVGETIQVASLNQYAKVDYGIDIITEEPTISYRDKKFVIQTPVRSDYESGSTEDAWGVEGRIRDKYLIIRLTYNTQLPLELLSVISTFRYSNS